MNEIDPSLSASLRSSKNLTDIPDSTTTQVGMAAPQQAKVAASSFLRPIPLWLLGVAMVLLFWAGMYLAYNSGGFKSNVFDPTIVSWTGAGTAAGPKKIDLKAIGKKVFVQNCAICHQETGLGVAGQFPPLVGSEWVHSREWHGDNHLVKGVLYGLQGPITVKGMPYNNAMAPWNQLSDQQIAGVLTYVRSSWGNNAPPITPEFVAKVRANTPPRSEAWTLPELKAIPRQMCEQSADNNANPASAAAPAK